jgi:hypothetical protein
MKNNNDQTLIDVRPFLMGKNEWPKPLFCGNFTIK